MQSRSFLIAQVLNYLTPQLNPPVQQYTVSTLEGKVSPRTSSEEASRKTLAFKER